MALAGLVVIGCFNAVALIAHVAALALAARALVGVGTGLAFVSGSAYVRVQGGSPFAQGLFGVYFFYFGIVFFYLSLENVTYLYFYFYFYFLTSFFFSFFYFYFYFILFFIFLFFFFFLIFSC